MLPPVERSIALRGGKSPVAAVSGASAVSGHDEKMIRCACSQSRDVRTDTLVRVPALTLKGGYVPIAGRCAILEMDSRGQSVGID